MGFNELETFCRELDRFDQAMLVTRRGESELRSRPMRVAGSDNRGHIWFLSSISTGKIDELTEFPSANVVMQDGQRFMSVSGVVRVTRDRELVDRFWSSSQGVWFEEGKYDPELVLLEIIPTYAEYWDRTGVEGLKFLLLEAQAMVTGESLDADAGPHKKIRFPTREAPRQQSSD